MDFTPALEDEAFRRELQQFLDDLLPSDWLGIGSMEGNDVVHEIGRKMGDRRWLVMAWPKEYGGLGASYWQQAIFKEETGLRHLPLGTSLAVNSIGPSIMIYGTDEQKAKYLPGIASGELEFCQMFSEPGSGSDLASLQTRAVRDGDEWVINGGKIWTSNAHRSDYGWLAARTDPDAPKHRGISTFVIPVKTPGLTVNPLINVAGELGLNQLFFDNVRVPASCLVGQENRGWYQMMTTLDFERSGMERYAPAKALVNNLVEFVQEQGGLDKRKAARYALANQVVTSEVGRMLAYRVVAMQSKGLQTSTESSISKTFNAHFFQGTAQLGVNLLGTYGQLAPGSRWAKLQGLMEHRYLTTIPTTISGGTVEINRNIIATRGLGLPRS
jgi:alkylation response protein AidB-like acyl-CoA dehydrogenase